MTAAIIKYYLHFKLLRFFFSGVVYDFQKTVRSFAAKHEEVGK
jgi:hypothetical protein